MDWIVIVTAVSLLTDYSIKKFFMLQKYPYTFLFSLLSFAIIYTAFDNPLMIVKGCVFTQTLIIIAYVDLEKREISNIMLVCTALCGLIEFNPIKSFTGAFAIFVIMFTLVYMGAGIGGGDIKFLSACGFVLGLRETVFASIITFTLFTLFALVLKKNKAFAYPLAPFISIGCFISFILTQ